MSHTRIAPVTSCFESASAFTSGRDLLPACEALSDNRSFLPSTTHRGFWVMWYKRPFCASWMAFCLQCSWLLHVSWYLSSFREILGRRLWLSRAILSLREFRWCLWEAFDTQKQAKHIATDPDVVILHHRFTRPTERQFSFTQWLAFFLLIRESRVFWRLRYWTGRFFQWLLIMPLRNFVFIKGFTTARHFWSILAIFVTSRHFERGWEAFLAMVLQYGDDELVRLQKPVEIHYYLVYWSSTKRSNRHSASQYQLILM